MDEMVDEWMDALIYPVGRWGAQLVEPWPAPWMYTMYICLNTVDVENKLEIIETFVLMPYSSYCLNIGTDGTLQPYHHKPTTMDITTSLSSQTHHHKLITANSSPQTLPHKLSPSPFSLPSSHSPSIFFPSPFSLPSSHSPFHLLSQFVIISYSRYL